MALQTTQQRGSDRPLCDTNAHILWHKFLYGSIAASAPYADEYLLTQMKLVKTTIPGV